MVKIHYAWFIMMACCAIQTSAGIIGTASSNLYPDISAELNIGIGTLTIYITIMSLTMAGLFPIAGKFLGRALKPALLIGGIVPYVALGCMSFFSNVYEFYVAGLFLGMGMSITIYMAVPILINMWFHKKAGIAMGIAMACNGCAAAIFSQVAGFALPIIGWRATFLLLAVCGLVIYVPMIALFVKTPEQKGVRPYGFEETRAIQKNIGKEEGLSFKEALEKPQFYCMLILCICLCAIQAETPHVSTASLVQFDVSVQTAASLLSIFSMGLVIGNISFGAIDDRLGHLLAFSLGMVLLISAHLLLIIGKISLVFVFSGTFLAGFSVATFTIIPPLMTNSIFGAKDYNRIWAYFMSAASISGAIAPPLYGFIFDLSGSYTLMYILIIVMTLVSLLCSIIAVRVSKVY